MTEANTNLPPLLLAYLGDAVFELLVRDRIVAEGAAPMKNLHRRATGYTRAAGQAEALGRLEPILTAAEADIVRRGRNTKARVPKNADMSEYRRATGLEALFGYLYLQGNWERMQELFAVLDGQA